jgi:hypothetical protein
MLPHGVSARIGLKTILASPSSFQVATPHVPREGASLQLSITTHPEARDWFLVVPLYTVRVAKMHAKFARVVQKGITTAFTISSPRAFRKGCWSKNDQRL